MGQQTVRWYQHGSNVSLLDLRRTYLQACVLGLDVLGEQGTLQWRHRTAVPEVLDVLTRRAVFSLCGALLGHLPVCGWLRVAASTRKCWASIVTKGWDDETADTLLVRMMTETTARVKKSDLARDWCMQGKERNVWVDASFLAIRVLWEKNRAVIEDTCWLRPMNDAAYISLAELDSVLNGINLALQWGVKKMHMRTDSLCMYHWVSDTFTCKVRVRTKAASEMLIRRRLSTIKKLADEYELSIDVTLVTSNCNLAEGLTWVPQR